MPITISGTTGIAGVDGSAATPAAQGSDTNTGVFYGTDTVSISTGGTARVVVNSDGQTVLGAGTASTDNALKNVWEYGNFADRNSSAIATLATALGLTSEQVDELFFEANELTV